MIASGQGCVWNETTQQYDKDCNLKLWDAASGSELRTLSGHTDWVDAVAFSPDGRTLVSGSEDNSLRLWDVSSGSELSTLSGHTSGVKAVAFSPDGRMIASGQGCAWNDTTQQYDKDCNRNPKLWDVASGRELHALSGHTDWVNAVAFSPDGRTLVSGNSDGTLKLWDVASGSELSTFSGHTGGIDALAFSPDGRTLVSGNSDRTLKLWDVASGSELSTFSGHTGGVRAVAFSPDGRTLVSGSVDNTLKLWDVARGNELRTLGYNHDIKAMALSPDGSTLASVSYYDNTLKLWDAVNGSELRTFSGHTSAVNAVAFSPDGRTLVSGSWQTIKLWDVASGSELRTLSGHTSVHAVAFSPDGRMIASGQGCVRNETTHKWDKDCNLKLWDAASGSELRTLSGHTDNVLAVAFSPDGRMIASGQGCVWNETTQQNDKDCNLKIWDVASGSELRTLEHPGYVFAVAFSPDGRTLVSGSDGGTLKLWDVASGSELHTLISRHTTYVVEAVAYSSPFAPAVAAVAFSPDGSTLISGSRHTLKLWDVASGNELRTLRGHTRDVSAVAFSPDSRRIYSGSLDRTIKVWDSGLVEAPPLTLPAELTLTVGDSQQITPLSGQAVSWTSENPALASVSNSGEVTGLGAGVVTITALDAGGLSASVKITVNAPAQAGNVGIFGKAFVIAGGGAHQNNTLFSYTDELTRRMYRLLKDRGFADEDIVYFTPMTWQDLDGDGVNENADEKLVNYQLVDPLNELNRAMDDVAGSFLPGQQFVLYIHSHGLKNPAALQLARSSDINGSQLRSLLDKLPDFVQQVLILDTCYSGAFLSELKDSERQRIVITSSDATAEAWNVRQENFSDSFINASRRGMNLLEAYTRAEQVIRRNSAQFAAQKPQLDDDNDGFYGLRDGMLAQKSWLGRSGASANPPPEIVQVHPVIQADNNGALLWVKTYPEGNERIRKVRARLMQQTGYDSVIYNGEATIFTANQAQLTYDAQNQRYQVLHQNFPQTGTWRVAYEAQDMQGVWSDMATGEVQVDNTVSPPSNPSQFSVTAGFNQSRYRIGERLVFSLDTANGDSALHDLYVALIFPSGDFYTFGFPLSMSFPNTIIPYQSQLNLQQAQHFPILDLVLPRGLASGDYQGCGVVAPAGSDPWDTALWEVVHCAGFVLE